MMVLVHASRMMRSHHVIWPTSIAGVHQLCDAIMHMSDLLHPQHWSSYPVIVLQAMPGSICALLLAY